VNGGVNTPGISQLLDEIERGIKRHNKEIPTANLIYGVQRSNAATAIYVGCNRKPQFEYGGRQNGSTQISAPRWDRSKSSTAATAFSGSYFPIKLRRTKWGVTGNQNSNMTAAKSEVIISQIQDRMETKFQQLLPHFRAPAFHLSYGVPSAI
jgi:hypothetical protein